MKVYVLSFLTLLFRDEGFRWRRFDKLSLCRYIDNGGPIIIRGKSRIHSIISIYTKRKLSNPDYYICIDISIKIFRVSYKSCRFGVITNRIDINVYIDFSKNALTRTICI